MQIFLRPKIFLGTKIFSDQIFFRHKICCDPKRISIKMIFRGIKQSFWTWGFLNCPAQRFNLNWSFTKSCFIFFGTKYFLYHVLIQKPKCTWEWSLVGHREKKSFMVNYFSLPFHFTLTDSEALLSSSSALAESTFLCSFSGYCLLEGYHLLELFTFISWFLAIKCIPLGKVS